MRVNTTSARIVEIVPVLVVLEPGLYIRPFLRSTGHKLCIVEVLVLASSPKGKLDRFWIRSIRYHLRLERESVASLGKVETVLGSGDVVLFGIEKRNRSVKTFCMPLQAQ